MRGKKMRAAGETYGELLTKPFPPQYRIAAVHLAAITDKI